MKLTNFKVLTFDCYGTLIDWESGILAALESLRVKAAIIRTDDEVLECYARHEYAQESETPGMLYPEVLASVYDRIAQEWKAKPERGAAAAFAASIAHWPAFPDSAAALQYLKQYFKLVILSNIDRESFRHSSAKLGVEFDAVYTAQDIGSYKPNPRNFEYLISHLAAMGYTKKDILHTAESLFHDHAPANCFGLASAWIHRRHAKTGHGATAKPEALPRYDFRFTSMQEMAQAHARELKNAA